MHDIKNLCLAIMNVLHSETCAMTHTLSKPLFNYNKAFLHAYIEAESVLVLLR